MKTQHPLAIGLAFFAIYIIWGTTYLAIIFGLKGFPPFILSAFRFSAAGLLLFLWCKVKGEKLPAKNITGVCIISGWLMLIGGSGLVTWAEKYISSGQAATITATEPFLFILFDRKRWGTYFSNKLIISGLLVGFLGLVLFFKNAFQYATAEKDILVVANLVLIGSAVLWVIGSLYTKNKLVSSDSNYMTTSLQLIAAGGGSALIACLNGEWTKFSMNAIAISAWGGLIYLIIMGSLVAYLAFRWLLTIRPPALVSTHTYINPVVAVILGWLIAGEQLSLWHIAGLFIILSGMLLTRISRSNCLD